METKQVKTQEELEENWKDCFIIGLPKSSRSKKKLIEGFNLGIRVMRRANPIYPLFHTQEIGRKK